MTHHHFTLQSSFKYINWLTRYSFVLEQTGRRKFRRPVCSSCKRSFQKRVLSQVCYTTLWSLFLFFVGDVLWYLVSSVIQLLRLLSWKHVVSWVSKNGQFFSTFPVPVWCEERTNRINQAVKWPKSTTLNLNGIEQRYFNNKKKP